MSCFFWECLLGEIISGCLMTVMSLMMTVMRTVSLWSKWLLCVSGKLEARNIGYNDNDDDHRHQNNDDVYDADGGEYVFWYFEDSIQRIALHNWWLLTKIDEESSSVFVNSHCVMMILITFLVRNLMMMVVMLMRMVQRMTLHNSRVLKLVHAGSWDFTVCYSTVGEQIFVSTTEYSSMQVENILLSAMSLMSLK